MKNFIQSVLSFFRKKDIIKEESGSSFYINVVCKGREKLDSELFDKNSNEYLLIMIRKHPQLPNYLKILLSNFRNNQ